MTLDPGKPPPPELQPRPRPDPGEVPRRAAATAARCLGAAMLRVLVAWIWTLLVRLVDALRRRR